MTAGCAQPRGEVFPARQQELVWPAPPDQPRIRFVGELKSNADLRAGKSAGQVWHEILYGPEAPVGLAKPHAVAVSADGNRVAVADTDAACVHVFNLATRAYRRFENYGGPQNVPTGVAWDGESLWVADAGLHAVAVFASSGSPRIIGVGVLKRPAGVAFCAELGRAYVSDAAGHAVIAFNRDGGQVLRFGSQGGEPGQFNFPGQIACAADGMVAVADAMNFRVQLFRPDGTLLRAFGNKGDAPGDFALPKGVAFDADGNVWVVDAHFENVQAFTPAGGLLMVLGREGQEPGEFWLPAGICIDPQRRIWIADTYNRRVQVFELMS